MAKSYVVMVCSPYQNTKALLDFNQNRERVARSSLLGLEKSLDKWITL
jgi:hypothetical protein